VGRGGNVIKELTSDHREVDVLFARIDTRGTGRPDPRHRVRPQDET